MIASILLTGVALLLIAGAIELWWGVATRQQQRAAAEHAETRLSTVPMHTESMPAASRASLARWQRLLSRAGLPPTMRTVLLLVAPGLLLTVAASVRLGSIWFGIFTGLLYALAATLWLQRRIETIRRRIVSQLPDFLENMVRMAGIGNSLSSAFQSAAQNVAPPLRPILDSTLAYSRAGMDLDRALQKAAQSYALQPLELLAVVLGTSIRIGGRSDQVLQRMSDFMRDLEQVQRELQATTSETRTSAWVLGLLPVACGLMMAMISPEFFQPMFQQPLGQKIMMFAVGLEGVGAFLLYRLAKSL